MAKKRILVVDDLEIFREPIALALEAEGHKVLSACNGSEALDLIKTAVVRFDLMIVDYSMPVMNGIELMKRAKIFPSAEATPSIMLTDSAQKEVVMQALSMGAKDYMLKSQFALPELLEKINSVLKGNL